MLSLLDQDLEDLKDGDTGAFGWPLIHLSLQELLVRMMPPATGEAHGVRRGLHPVAQGKTLLISMDFLISSHHGCS